MKGYGLIQWVDLSSGDQRREPVPDDLALKFIGGKGLGAKLLYDMTDERTDPLSPDNPLIFAIGPFTGTAVPYSGKGTFIFRSPQTGIIGESVVGGTFGAAFRWVGYTALVITGRAEKPVYLVVREDGVEVKDASHLWGKTIYETEETLKKEYGRSSVASIGPAGENLVKYAVIGNEKWRQAGRTGGGAVMGSKKLKAIVIIGTESFRVPDPKGYREVYDEIYRMAVASSLTKKYHDLGTAANILPLNKIGALPTRNFSSGKFELAEEISGEKLAETVLARRIACTNCPVACIHIAGLREEYPEEKFFYKVKMIPYDYELLYALGSNLGVGSREGVLKLIQAVEEDGLDAISTGIVLAWATEAYLRGLVSEKETLVPLNWGHWDNYVKAIHNIVAQPNDFYKTLALGVEEAARRYGGLEFALSYNRVEPAGYHTGPLYIASLVTGFRHSHLDAGAYSMDEALVKESRNLPPPNKAASMIVDEESWRQILNSLVICLFARKIYKPEIVAKALKPLGYELEPQDLVELGRRIYVEKQNIKAREGYDPLRTRIPRRALETPTPLGRVAEEYLRSVIAEIKRFWEQKA